MPNAGIHMQICDISHKIIFCRSKRDGTAFNYRLRFLLQNSLPKALSKRFFSNNKLTKAFVIKIFLIKLVERGGNCVCLSYILPDNARQYFFFFFFSCLCLRKVFPNVSIALQFLFFFRLFIPEKYKEKDF